MSKFEFKDLADDNVEVVLIDILDMPPEVLVTVTDGEAVASMLLGKQHIKNIEDILSILKELK